MSNRLISNKFVSVNRNNWNPNCIVKLKCSVRQIYLGDAHCIASSKIVLCRQNQTHHEGFLMLVVNIHM